jgi:RNA polymerase sigma-70 factor, ECF subfamily
MSDERDLRIAAGLQAGKSEAWTALYEACFDRVWRLAARMIGPDAAAVADVVQETFLAAARSARGFDPERGELWPWLAGITRNHVTAYFRSRRRDGRIREGGDLHAAVAAQQRQAVAGPPGDCIVAEEAQRVRATLAELPEEYQALLSARYLEDVPVEQIAAQGHSTLAAIRSKLARARAAFREAFGAGAAHERD